MEVRAKKGLGQHFLTDQAIAQNIVGALKGSPVLEVGPGMGVLTRYLLTRSDGVCRASTASQSSAPPFASLTVPPLNVPRVAVVSPPAAPSDRDDSERSDSGSLRGTPLSPPPGVQGGESSRLLKAVEIDKESVDYLKKHFPQLGEGLIEGDFLKMDLASVFPGEYSVIGNFPYNISSQIFFKVLDYREQVPEVVCMIQKEVAERIAEGPGSKTYGILSVLLQAWYDIEYLFTVEPGAFAPPPKVRSAVIRLRRNSRKQLVASPHCVSGTYSKSSGENTPDDFKQLADNQGVVDERLFKTVVKTAFNQRRKTLRNALKPMLNPEAEGFAEFIADPVFDLRAERLGVEDFIALTEKCSSFVKV